ncbi:TonB-dependent receptor [Fulvivirga lutea]|uniref:TonB-dependent receptor n=1 Tax=Fulvivirga lutea TaxID=2810512 RepID=A0A974WHS6_9BACT|nr:TonB-dependent receptor [Fulvivirga lutea]QSE98788.1 TonB-dependent receptor [Fulvivirga lutea]
MKRFIYLSLLITTLYAQFAFGQTTIKGQVLSAKGEQLIGANIYLDNTYDGTSSDINGQFTFKTNEKNEQTLVVSMIGYHEYREIINCNGQPLQFTVNLREKIDEMTAVTITAGAMDASDEKKAVVMKPLDIVTTSGALGDVIGALTKLPGTSTVGNDGRLFVRGGDASETNIYFDGLQVGNAYGSTAQNVPTRSRFNPNLFRGSFFSTGGYSAEYGQALSSALVLNSIDMPIRDQTDISLMSVGGGLSHTMVGENRAFTASANFTDLSPYMSIINQNMDFTDAPSNWDAEVLGRQKIGKSGILKGFMHIEGAKMSLNREDINSGEIQATTIENSYQFGNVSFRNVAGNGWSYYGGASISNNEDRISIDNENYTRTSLLNHNKAVLIKDFSDKFSLKNGLEAYANQYEETVLNDGMSRKLDELTINHFIEADYYFSSNLVLRAGIRSTYNDLLEDNWSTYRASLGYKFSKYSQVSVASGTFNQLPANEVRIQNTALENTQSTHYIANYLYSKEGRTFRTEAFYKSYDNLVLFGQSDGLDFTDLTNDGSGYAQGFDLFYRDNKSLKNTDFWITYSYTDSKRNLSGFESQVRPGFAPLHNASLVMKKFFRELRSQLGFSYSWNSGYTYHNPNLEGEMQSETPAFNNLSLSWSYLPTPNLIIHFECSNVLGSDNIFGYQYTNQANENGVFEGRPQGMVADRFIFLGVFLTLSKDKKANQLNNL